MFTKKLNKTEIKKNILLKLTNIKNDKIKKIFKLKNKILSQKFF